MPLAHLRRGIAHVGTGSIVGGQEEMSAGAYLLYPGRSRLDRIGLIRAASASAFSARSLMLLPHCGQPNSRKIRALFRPTKQVNSPIIARRDLAKKPM